MTTLPCSNDQHDPIFRRLLDPSRGVKGWKATLAGILLGTCILGPVDSAAAQFYKVRKGDTLSAIARQFGTSVGAIKRANHLHGAGIRMGSKLALPDIGGGDRCTSKGRSSRGEGDQCGTKALASETSAPKNAGEPSASQTTESPQDTGGQLQAENASASAMDMVQHESSPTKGLFARAKKGAATLTALVEEAISYVGIPYRFGASNDNGVDCSGFVRRVFRSADLQLPRTAAEQFNVGAHVEKDELEKGDLVFFTTYKRGASHVGIYLGDSLFVHASSKLRAVTVDSLEQGYYRKRFLGARRLRLAAVD